jgi:uncharacterized protein (TIGR02453 family)
VWFDAQKARYQTDWLEPAIAYVSALSDHVARLKPPHKAEALINGSIRRLQRDTRFSRDKTPYDPKLHLIFWTGDHPNRSPAIHIVLHPDRLGLGAGHFAMSKAELERYRDVVANDAQARQELVDHLEQLRSHACTLTEDTLKRVPKGFAIPPEHETLLKRKGLVARTHEGSLSPEQICDTARMKSFFDAAAALNHWVCERIT